jgi:hypothetical protein
MSAQIWIAIGIAAVANIITIIGIVIGWKMSSRQIQIMLEQASPAEKTPRIKILWMPYILIGATLVALVLSSFWILYIVISMPLIPRLLVMMIVVHSFVFYFNFGALRYWLRKPRRQIIKTQNPQE